jgi:proteasome accessory factor A
MAIPKVMGTEIEYGITVRGDPDFDPISSCVLLVNAYREDHAGAILWDYEQENPLADARGRDLVIHEKAGERIIEIARREANALLPDGSQMLIYKNNSDRKGNSYGAHENYLMDRRTSFKQIVENLMPFFVTRQVYTGAGKVGSENRGQHCDFQLSQRADFFETEVALDTMVKRPIINTRDEPHADREKYRRLHVICGDSNLSEYTIYLRSGVTSLILSMIEDGAIKKDLSLRDPVRSIKETSHDPTCTKELQLDDGKRLTAVQIQAEYLEMALNYVAAGGADPMTKDILSKWEHVIDCLGRDPMELDQQIDWVMKKSLIEQFMDRKSIGWDAPQVHMLDLQYHDLRPEKGLYYILEKQGRAERIVTDEEISAAILEPPDDTRAYFRGECLKRYGAAVFGVNWDSISFGVGDDPINRILMVEPLKGTRTHVGDLLDNSPTVIELVDNLRA